MGKSERALRGLVRPVWSLEDEEVADTNAGSSRLLATDEGDSDPDGCVDDDDATAATAGGGGSGGGGVSLSSPDEKVAEDEVVEAIVKKLKAIIYPLCLCL